jgi:hypothetical protein
VYPGGFEDWKIGRLKNWKIGRFEDCLGNNKKEKVVLDDRIDLKIGKLQDWKIGGLIWRLSITRAHRKIPIGD